MKNEKRQKISIDGAFKFLMIVGEREARKSTTVPRQGSTEYCLIDSYSTDY